MNNDFIFFYGGIYSQWHPSKFSIRGVTYNCAEQYMMAQKALHFSDGQAFDEIMATTNPAEQKAIGRRVKNFDRESWERVARQVVYEANLAKFTQNRTLKTALGETGNKEIVEASPTDPIWGIGLSELDPKRWDKSKWQGTNWLGEAIMKVRSELFPTKKF